MGLLQSKRNTIDSKFLTPHGLYESCPWDKKTLKKLILEKKVAPFYPGQEENTSKELDECPICFLYYHGGLNRARCCNKELCTECFLQIKKPDTLPSKCFCPFCNSPKFGVVFLGPKTTEERQKEEEEENKVLEIQRKMRLKEIENDRKKTLERKKAKEEEAERLKLKEEENQTTKTQKK